MEHNKTRKIRLFNTFEPVTTFYRDLFPYWLAHGWEIEVMMSRARYRADRMRTWEREDVRIHWTPGAGLQATNQFNKLLIMLLYILSAVVRTLVGPRVDHNIFLTQPPLFYLWGRILQLLRKQPYSVVIMDLHPDLFVQAGIMSENALTTRLLRRLATHGLRHADGVIVIGRCMNQRIIQLGVAAERIHTIPNWADEEIIFPIPHHDNPFRQQEQWRDKFIVLYSGNIGIPHYFDDILEISRRLRDCTDLHFVFIGQGHRRKEVEQYKARHRLDNILLLPYQPLERLAQSLSAGDLHFVSLRPGYEGIVVPSKAYSILAAGRPILYQGSSRGEIARIINEEKVGTVVPVHDPEALEQAILNYWHHRTLGEEQGRRARKLATSKYGKQQACLHYTAILSKQV